MLDLNIIIDEQIEMILHIIEEFLIDNSTLSTFQFGFIYIKLIDIIKTKIA